MFKVEQLKFSFHSDSETIRTQVLDTMYKPLNEAECAQSQEEAHHKRSPGPSLVCKSNGTEINNDKTLSL